MRWRRIAAFAAKATSNWAGCARRTPSRPSPSRMALPHTSPATQIRPRAASTASSGVNGADDAGRRDIADTDRRKLPRFVDRLAPGARLHCPLSYRTSQHICHIPVSQRLSRGEAQTDERRRHHFQTCMCPGEIQRGKSTTATVGSHARSSGGWEAIGSHCRECGRYDMDWSGRETIVERCCSATPTVTWAAWGPSLLGRLQVSTRI